MKARTAAVVLGACVAAVIASAACSAHMPYPKSWPAIADTRDGTCHNVTGNYRDPGETGSSRTSRYSLVQLLTEQGPPMPQPVKSTVHEAPQVDHVTLSFLRAGEFQVLAIRPNHQSLSTVYAAKTGAYACRTGAVILKKRPQWVGSGMEIGAARFSETLELRSSENYLVVKWQEHSFMLIGFMVPATYRQSDWYRFERCPEQHDCSSSPDE